MMRFNTYVVREFVGDECGCGTYRERRYVVPEEDCGCQEELSPGDRVRVRYDRFGNAWIVGAEDGPDACGCGCVDPEFASREQRGPRYGWQLPYRGTYAGPKKAGECSE